jgi:hypothetical protein
LLQLFYFRPISAENWTLDSDDSTCLINGTKRVSLDAESNFIASSSSSSSYSSSSSGLDLERSGKIWKGNGFYSVRTILMFLRHSKLPHPQYVKIVTQSHPELTPVHRYVC